MNLYRKESKIRKSMRKRIDLSLVLACYNEAPLLIASVERIVSMLNISRLTYELIFVDDKSSDGTPMIIRSILKKHPKWKAIFHKINMGRGRSVSDGIQKARGKVVGYIDVDLEVSPVYISSMVQPILAGTCDIIIGERIYRTTFTSVSREVLSRGYRWVADKMVATGGLDTETGYKFFHRKKILPILKYIRHRHWFWDTEIIVFARRAGLRIAEVPVLFIRRFDKRSSVHLMSDISDYARSLWELWQRLL